MHKARDARCQRSFLTGVVAFTRLGRDHLARKLYKEGHQEGVLTHSRDGIVDLHGFPVDVAVRTPSKARNLNNVTLKSK